MVSGANGLSSWRKVARGAELKAALASSFTALRMTDLV
jgi:hypothetical protein